MVGVVSTYCVCVARAPVSLRRAVTVNCDELHVLQGPAASLPVVASLPQLVRRIYFSMENVVLFENVIPCLFTHSNFIPSLNSSLPQLRNERSAALALLEELGGE